MHALYSTETDLNLTSEVPANCDKLMMQFEMLCTKTEKFLQESGCAAQSAVICVMDIKQVICSVKSSTLKELESASSISDVFHVLKKRNLICFLHYEVTKYIITKLCPGCNDLHMSLAHYEALFECFIKTPIHKSCVCCNEKFEILSVTDSEENIDLILIADDSITSFADVQNLENIVAKAFRCSQIIFNIQYIDLQASSVTLCYGIPLSMVDSIFPLTTEEWDELRFHGVSEMHCMECHYMLDNKGIAQVIKCPPVLEVTTFPFMCSSYWCSHESF